MKVSTVPNSTTLRTEPLTHRPVEGISVINTEHPWVLIPLHGVTFSPLVNFFLFCGLKWKDEGKNHTFHGSLPCQINYMSTNDNYKDSLFLLVCPCLTICSSFCFHSLEVIEENEQHVVGCSLFFLTQESLRSSLLTSLVLFPDV